MRDQQSGPASRVGDRGRDRLGPRETSRTAESARVELGGASRVQLGERLDTVSACRPPTLRDPGDKRLIETGQPGQHLGLVDRRQEGVGVEHRLLNDRSPGLVQEVGQHGAGVENGQQLTVVDPKPVRQASQPAISAQPVRLGLGFSSALRDQLVHQAPPLGQMSQRPPTGPGTLGPVTIRCRWLGHVDQLTSPTPSPPAWSGMSKPGAVRSGRRHCFGHGFSHTLRPGLQRVGAGRSKSVGSDMVERHGWGKLGVSVSRHCLFKWGSQPPAAPTARAAGRPPAGSRRQPGRPAQPRAVSMAASSNARVRRYCPPSWQ